MPGWLARARAHYRRAGLRGVRRAAVANILRRPVEVELRTAGILHPVSVRLRTSDLWTFDQIFVDREYDLPLPANPRTIIDAGAHIGLASVYLANRFPGARIIALEPEASNFSLLQRNAAPYPNIDPVCAALWSESCRLHVVDHGLGTWAYRTERNASSGASALGTVDAITLNQLLDQRSLAAADILKIDVEGAEKEIFDHASDWIDRVHTLVVELHDRYTPGCSRSFYGATRGFPYRWHRGENVVVSRDDHGGMVAMILDPEARAAREE
jgi:FkbM family methyltransferase